MIKVVIQAKEEKRKSVYEVRVSNGVSAPASETKTMYERKAKEREGK
jgi:hypothetical protein